MTRKSTAIDSTKKRSKQLAVAEDSSSRATEDVPQDLCDVAIEAISEPHEQTAPLPTTQKNRTTKRKSTTARKSASEADLTKRTRRVKMLPGSDRAIDLTDVDVEEEGTAGSIDEADVTITSIDPTKKEQYLKR